MGQPAGEWGRPEKDWSIPSQQGASPGEPDSPMDLDAADWKEILKCTLKEIKKDRVSLTAGALAFYWFLAIFPLLIAAVGLVTLLRLPSSTVAEITDSIKAVLPGDAAVILTSAVEGASKNADGALIPLIIGLAVALWSASSGVAGMLSGLNIAYDVAEDRKFVKKRIVSLGLLLVMFALGGSAAALLVFGGPIGEWVGDKLPIGGSVFVWLWTAGRVIGALLAVTTMLAIFYLYGPNREHPKWEWISPGGIVAALIWLAASLAFSFYVTNFGSYAETYGALTGVILLILWLYLGGLAILIGGELNAELERQGEKKKSRLQGASLTR